MPWSTVAGNVHAAVSPRRADRRGPNASASPRRSARSGSPGSSAPIRASSRAACACASRSPAPWSPIPTCCCSTSPSPHSTRSPAWPSTTICCGCGRAAADRRFCHPQRLRIGLPVDPDRGHDGAAGPDCRRSGGRAAATARARAAHLARLCGDLRGGVERTGARDGDPHPNPPPQAGEGRGGGMIACRCAASAGCRISRGLAGDRRGRGDPHLYPAGPRADRRKLCGPTGRACWARCW